MVGSGVVGSSVVASGVCGFRRGGFGCGARIGRPDPDALGLGLPFGGQEAIFVLDVGFEGRHPRETFSHQSLVEQLAIKVGYPDVGQGAIVRVYAVLIELQRDVLGLRVAPW